MTQELRKLRKLAERATPGYWSYSGREYADNGGTFETIEAETDTVIGEYSLSEKDARYIAAASPAAILALLDRLEKAEKDAARLDYMQQGVTVELLYYGPNRNFRIGGRFLAIDSDIRTAIDAAMEASK